MKIVSNDYLSSLPNSPINIKGGPPRFAADFSKFIITNGHEWHGLIALGKDDNEFDALETEPQKFLWGRQLIRTGLEGVREITEMDNSLIFYQEEINKIEKLLEQIKPDLLFLNGFSVYCWVLLVAAKNQGIPVATQHAGLFTKEVKIYEDLFTPTSIKVCREMTQSLVDLADANIFLNEFSYNALQKDLGVNEIKNSHIVPLPRPDWPMAENFTPKPTKEKKLGIVARWDRIKNHQAILALAEEIKKQNLPWTIYAVTKIPGTPKFAEFKNKYRETINIIPPMDREQLKDFYGSLDLLILPSHFDVSPTVVMEGLTVGLPTVISENVGWVSEYEQCGMKSWIANFNEPAEVVNLIAEKFSADGWPEVAKFAKYVKINHNQTKVFSDYLALFKRLLL